MPRSFPSVSAPNSPDGAGQTPGLLEAMFEWWNDQFAKGEPFTVAGLSRFFHPDIHMIINGELRADGLDGLAARFETVRASCRTVEVELPFVETFRSDDRVFTHHRVSAETENGPMMEVVMGYVVTDGDLIRVINFLSIDGAPQTD